MNGPESHHELDDELLSAYLDDELSPEDRARVEARLATDSSAAELLHQLRSVSQAVQALPPEGAGDLRDAVLKRVGHLGNKSTSALPPAAAQAERPVSPAGTSAAAGSSPSLSIGRTRRGWVWASLAVAAALLIMVLQQEPDRDKVAVVADRDSKSESGSNRWRDFELRAPAEENDRLAASQPAAPAGPASTDVAPEVPLDGVVAQSEEVAPAPEQSVTEFDTGGLQGGAGGAPMRRSTEHLAQETRSAEYYSDDARASGLATEALPNSSMETLADNRPAATPPAETAERGGQLGDALAYGDRPELLKEESQVAGDSLVVVRVVASKDALAANAFERLLERNGVEVVSAANGAVSEGLLSANVRSRRFAVQDQSRLERPTQPQRDEREPPAVEAVLVEAPEQTIISCLDSLNRDNENYLGLEVEDASAKEAQVAALGTVQAQSAPKAAAPSDWRWTKYNRGIVPQDKDGVLQDQYSYVDEAQSFGGGRLGARAEAVQELRQLKETELSLARKNLSEAKNAKAVRLQTWGLDTWDRAAEPARDADASAPASGAAEPNKLNDLERRLSAAAPTDNDNLQVLFLLQPDESAAPSPATKARAQ